MNFISKRHRLLRVAAAIAMLTQQLLWAPSSQSSLLFAQDGAVVVGGNASIVHSGTTLDITTQTDRTVINWNTFNIDAGHTTNFYQPGVNSAVLNRVITPNNPSAIFGNLNSNGNVYLVNPSGVIVGSSGVINTNGFTASVLDISTNEFMQGGVLNFRGGSKASIINQGTIYTGTGGTTLIGGTVINEGLIESNGGSINLLTGGSVTLKGGGVYTQADQTTIMNGISETSGLIKNSGTLRATGSLEVGGEVYLVSPGGTVIQEAIIAASKKDANDSTQGGNVLVDAGEGQATVSGNIDVQGKTGGTVTVTGKQVKLQDALIDASGDNGGGTIYIGGGFQGNDASIANSELTFINANSLLRADAGISGDGGTVIVWSDGATDYFGAISNQGSRIGTGGFTEVSGKARLNFAGAVNTGGGDLLLDPFSYFIDATAAANILAALGTNNVTIQTSADVAGFGSSGNNADAGDIVVNADILWDSPNSLTMLAHRNVNFYASVQNRNDTGGDLNIVAGWDGTKSFNLNDFVAADVTNTTLFGNNSGSVFIGDGTQTSGVAVGSRRGNTNVFGYDVKLQAANGAGADGRFAQLGFQVTDGVALGGFDLDPTSADGVNVIVDGGITVHSINDVTATGGGGSKYNYVQIGHVGADVAFDSNVEAMAESLIEMAAGGDLTFTAGTRSAYAQLGQGGNRAMGHLSGTITIAQVNDIIFTGGVGRLAYAQLGQGGFGARGNHSGTTTITQVHDLEFTGGAGRFSYAQLGQGGAFADGNHRGTLAITQAHDLSFTAGAGHDAYTQLGQGGKSADGNHSGSLTITQANNITFTAGDAGSAYAQLGQGGGASAGNHSGTLTITQVNDLNFSGGAGRFAYAQLGQGGAFADGNHRGTLTITRAHDITFTGGDADGAYTQLGQGGFDSDGNHSGTTTITQVHELTFTGGVGRLAYAQLGQGGFGARGNHSGITTITQVHDLIFRSGNGDYASAQLGHGGYEAYGDHSGAITIVQANDLNFSGGSGDYSSAQLGHGGESAEGNHSGVVTITQVNNLMFSGGSGYFSYAQLGHGGNYAAGNSSGAITIAQANDLSFSVGNGFLSSVRLGHGGEGADGNHSGIIDVTLDGNLTLVGRDLVENFALIGHGDNPFDGDAGNTVSGDVTLRVGGSAMLSKAYIGHLIDPDGTYTSGNTFLGVRGDLTTDAGSQFLSAPAANNGELRFYVAGNDLVNSATLLNGVAHGGTPFPNDQGNFGFGTGPYNPAVNTNFAYYHLPNLFNYDVDATDAANILAALAGGNVTLASDLDQSNFGSFFDWDGGTQYININSDLLYNSPHSLTMQATGDINFNARVQNRNANGGDLNLVAGWDLMTPFNLNDLVAADVTSTTLFGNDNGSVFIGDGTQARGVAVGSRSGNTNVFAYDVNLQGGTGSGANRRFAQLGFYVIDGRGFDGTYLGLPYRDGRNVVVNGGMTLHSINAVTAKGGNGSNYNYAQIGHIGSDHAMDYLVDANTESLMELTAGGDVVFIGGAGEFSYAQFGHGGFYARGDFGGTTTVSKANNLIFKGGSGRSSYAQFGHGGWSSAGDFSGTTTITQVNDLIFTGGQGNSSYAQLGHGGIVANGNHNGTTTITQAHDLIFKGGKGRFAYAQLGQGGRGVSGGVNNGSMLIEQAHDLIFTGGKGWNAYAQLGQGGSNVLGILDGTTTITQVHDLIFTGGRGRRAYAQLGQGGYLSSGVQNGTLTISQAHNLFFTGGNESSYAQLGQGGIRIDGIEMGTTTITQVNNLIFTGGYGNNAYAQLGQGGLFARGSYSGAITITQAKDIIFTGGSGFSAYAHLGNGGALTQEGHTGTISISQANDLIFTGGAGDRSYVQLGQGGADADGNHSGTIDVTLDGNLTLTGQDLTDQYALIGHGDELGGSDAGNTVSGDINMRVGGSATLTNAFIGHLIDADGTYTSGKTHIAIGTGNFAGDNVSDKLVIDSDSQFFSASTVNGGELRFYLPRKSSFQAADGAKLNGTDVATFANELPNRQGIFQPFNGPYTINAADGNFAFYMAIIELVVNANSGSSTYGDTPINPGLDLFSGTLLSGDTLASIGLTNNFSLTATSDANTYVLSVDATNLDSSYTLVGSTGGTFTINPADLTITPTDLTKEITVLGVLNGTTDFTAIGLKNGDTVDSVTLISDGAPATALVGTYPIVASDPVGSLDLNNYNITFIEGTLTVEPFSALVDVDNLTQDIFTRHQNYFNSVDSLVKPTGPGGINWIGIPGSTNGEEEASSPIEEGTIPFEIRINSLQASN